MKIPVSLIEDDAGFREATAQLINRTPDLRCRSVHPNAEHAWRYLPEAGPAVALVDIQLPRLSGIECVRRLHAVLPKLLPVMLTNFGDDDLIFESLKAGAVGYVLKRAGAQAILNAIREVHAGGSPMSPEIARKVALHFQRAVSPSSADHGLTPREVEVLRQVDGGERSADIARRLGISQATVHNHLRHIYEKLQVSSRGAAAAKVFRK